MKFISITQTFCILVLFFILISDFLYAQSSLKMQKRHFLERKEDQPFLGNEQVDNKGKQGVFPSEEKKRSYTIAPYRSKEHELQAFREIVNFKKFASPEGANQSNSWVTRGPYGFQYTNNTNTIFAGRVNSIAYRTDGKIYVAASHGGLWGPKQPYSDLRPLSDGLPTLSIGAVAVHPTDNDTVFLATGDYNTGDPSFGIYRSYNGGTSWSLLTTPLPSSARYSKLMVSTWDHNVVFASSTVGMIRSTDLGDTWTQVMDINKNVSDFDAAHGGYVMLAGVQNDGAYRSSDSGATWTRIPLPSDTASTMNRGRIAVGISATAYTFAYIVVGRVRDAGIIGVYRTETSNIITNPTWITVTPPAPLNGYMWGQQFYNNALAVSKWDANTVYLGGGTLLKTTNGGGVWRDIGALPIHADIHSVVSTSDSNNIYVGSDGGVFVSRNGGTNWSVEYNRQLPTVEFYQIDVDIDDPNNLYGAAQDNGILKSTASNRFWYGLYCCDGLEVNMDQENPNNVYGVVATPAARYISTNSGSNWNRLNPGGTERTDWSTSMVPDPARRNWVYSNNRFYALYSTNKGANWDTMGARYGCTGVYPNTDASVVYATSSQRFFPLYRFDWVGGTTRWSFVNLSPQFPRKEVVSRVIPSIVRVNRAYAIVNKVDSARIFVTTDKGSTWQNITGDLPDVQVNDLIESPYNPFIMWIGTEKGAFKSTDGGLSWYRWNDGLPEAVKIADLEYSFYREGGTNRDYIMAGTFGRGAYERKVDAEDVRTILSRIQIAMGTLPHWFSATDSFFIHNTGGSTLLIPTIYSTDLNITPIPASAQIPPLESLIVYLNINAGKMKPGVFSHEINVVHHEDNPNAIAETSIVAISGIVEDTTKYRSFIPESLVAKTLIRPKALKSSWCFSIKPGENGWDSTRALPSKVRLQFKNIVDAIVEFDPFLTAKKVDKSGYVWQLSDGEVNIGQSITICGRNKKIISQELVSVIWYDEVDSVVYSETKVSPEYSGNTPPLPTSANVRKEVFSRYPFNRLSPFIVGVLDINWKKNNIAYVSFSTEADMLNSLKPDRYGKAHTGTASCFDYYNNQKKMTGGLRSLPFTKQDNHLFAQVTALKFNIAASALGVTPRGFGELRYSDTLSSFDGYLVRDIAAIADTFMTYCVDSVVTDPLAIDSVITRINKAFSGAIDTVSFAKSLSLTGVRPVSEIDYLEQDPSVIPTAIAGISLSEKNVPSIFALYQNYPNPFNPSTTISFDLHEDEIVTLTLYNVLGQQVEKLIDMQEMEAGQHDITFEANNLSTGVYFYRITIESTDENNSKHILTDVKKMMLVK